MKNFVIRKSGKFLGKYYIDYMGVYRVNKIASAINVDPVFIQETYEENGAEYNKELGVYYFNKEQDAETAVNSILTSYSLAVGGKVIYFTQPELEFIRKALINTDGNMLHNLSKIKDSILEKLN